MKKFNCLYCKKEKTHQSSQSMGKYCSAKCQQNFQIEKKMESGNCLYTPGIRNWCYNNLKQVCDVCDTGLIWNNKPLRLQVDHRNGNSRDNRRNNLRMICPNCHTQTENWGIKNASPEGVEKMVVAGKLTQKNFWSYKVIVT